MIWQYNVFALPLFFGAFMSLGLSLFMLGRRRITGAPAFTVLLLLIAEWCLADGLEYVSADLPSILFWDKVLFVGFVSVPVACLIFVLYYTGRNGWLRARIISLLFIIPVITLLLRWTDEVHHLIYSEYGLVTSYGLSILQWTWGNWFCVDAAYSYILSLVAIALLVQYFLHSQGVARWQSLILILSISVPLAASVFDVLDFNLPFDCTPLALTFTGFADFWAVFRFRLFELMPVVRETIVRDMADGVIVFDSGNRLMDINPAGERIFGSAAGILGKSATEFFKEHGLNSQCLTKESSEISLTIDGVKRYFDLTFTQLEDNKRGLRGRIGVLRDITDIAMSERKYRLLSDNMPDAVFTMDLQGRLTFASPRAKMTGYSVQELLTMNIKELIPPDDLAEVLNRLAARSRGETELPPLQLDLIRSDGTRLPIEIHTILLTEGNTPVGVQGIARDVSERKQMEDALRESEARFRELADLLPQIVFEMNKRGVFTFVNSVGLSSLGYTEQDRRGGFDAFQVFPPEDAKRVIENMRRVMRGEQTGPNEYNLMKRDGTLIPALVYSSAIVRNGRSEGLRGIIIDLTERKKLEAQVVESQRLAAIGETTTLVGHDLRNPLQTMTSTAYLVRKLVASERAEDRKLAGELLGTLDDTIRYIDKIVSDLQDYARPVGADLVETSLPDLFRATVSNVKIPQNVQVTMDIQGNSSNLILDPTLLKRVLTNLILNAVQAMPNGGKLTIASSSGDDSITFAVRDTGIGITPENLRKIFHPFFTTKAQGQGLGLPVCKRLIEAHGGTIDVTSHVGKGSAFTFKIPTNRKPYAMQATSLDPAILGREG
jgi:PAS domain S-box-containing protein